MLKQKIDESKKKINELFAKDQKAKHDYRQQKLEQRKKLESSVPVDFSLTEIRPNTQLTVLLKALSVSIELMPERRSYHLCAGVWIGQRS